MNDNFPDVDSVVLFFDKMACCGGRDIVLPFLRKLLATIEGRTRACADVTSYEDECRKIDQMMPNIDTPEYWIIWYWLDQAGLTEHRSGIRGSWLSKLGQDFYDALQTCSDKELLEC